VLNDCSEVTSDRLLKILHLVFGLLFLKLFKSHIYKHSIAKSTVFKGYYKEDTFWDKTPFSLIEVPTFSRTHFSLMFGVENENCNRSRISSETSLNLYI
jgi:hypothetical protein